MKRKVKWRTLKFIPIGGDESQAITLKQKGFMHLCEKLRDGGFSGYTVHDTKRLFDTVNHNLPIDWSDFRKALIKFSLNGVPEKPSVFCGEHFPSEHTIRMRKRLLAAALREYITAQSLAEDLLEWLSRGREEDTRRFVITVLHGVGWFKEPPRTPEAAAAAPIQPPDGTVLMLR